MYDSKSAINSIESVNSMRIILLILCAIHIGGCYAGPLSQREYRAIKDSARHLTVTPIVAERSHYIGAQIGRLLGKMALRSIGF